MLVVSRFIYDLASLSRPTEDELEEEIERLLYITTAEEPNYLVETDSPDHDVLTEWIDKKFKPVLMMLLLERADNYRQSKGELCKMDRYATWVNKFLRPSFVKRHATKRVREYYFTNLDPPSLEHATLDLRRTLTLISNHLANNKCETLFDTDQYTTADTRLYRYLKRLVLGDYYNYGLTRHVKLCEPLVKFMRRYAQKNSNIIDISMGDPLANKNKESSLVADLVRAGTIGFGCILFFLYLRRR